MRMPLLALAGLCLAACQPESDKTNPAVATDEAVAEREAAAPAIGANSFTQEQAQQRIEAAGYTGVTELTKGEDGIWRAVASLGGQTQEVSVDYQGNVTGGTAMSTDPALATSPASPPAMPAEPSVPPATPPTNPSQE
ncbi:MAG TPA: hypothetical protein VIA80_09595 [Hyphomonadaceae bacterium]|jgi:hypothetical protein